MMSYAMSQNLTSTQSNRCKAYFEKSLEECGIDLHENDELVILRKEQSLVGRDITKFLKENDKLDDFVRGMKMFVKSKENFHKMLLNTLMKKRNEELRELKIHQDSVFRIFLNVEAIQKNVIDIILDEATNVVSEEEPDTGWLRLLLNALRYLSIIQDSQTLTIKLLDILEISSVPCQLEILNNLPEILPDSHFNDISKELIKLLESHPNLTGAILDCLNSLNINGDVRTEVQNYILENILSSGNQEAFPVIFEFLVTDCKADNIQNVLFKCRNALDSLIGSESVDKSAKALILTKLYTCAVMPKSLYEGWVNVIAGIKVNNEHKPIDILILFVLYATSTNRKKNIESLFKKRVKNGMFKKGLLDHLFQKYIISQFLSDYLNNIIEISMSLLQQNDPNLVEFGSQIMILVFCHELMSRVQQQDVLHNLILLVGASKAKTVENVLALLLNLSKLEAHRMAEHILQLMGLLEKLDTYELSAVKQIFELLCSLTCGPEAQESAMALKDELHMLIRKQLSSSKKTIKLRGIVAAVTMVKYVSIVLQDQSLLEIPDESIMTISDIPAGSSQEGARLLELVTTCSSSSAEYTTIYYDQLAVMLVTTENLEKYFFTWMFETFTTGFQEIFVVDNVQSRINDIPIISQFSLNQAHEIEDPISINIAEFSMLNKQPSILTLAPLFRLLRLLHYRHENGNLSSIDALLGCGVLLPNLSDVTNYDIDQVKQIADCVFHCINWFREVVSAFVTQTNKSLRIKVLSRLEDIIELEKVLYKCLEIVPEHKLPTTQLSSSFQIARSPIKSPPRKRFKPNSNASTSTSQNSKTTTKSISKKSVKENEISYREIDIDIILLLKYPLKIDDYEEPLAQSTQTDIAQNQTNISITQFQFLMKDFIGKLQVLTKNSKLGLSNLSIINTSDVITDSMRMFPIINNHLIKLSDYLKRFNLEETAIEDDTDLNKKVVSIKQSFNLIFECFSLVFSWNGFLNNKNLPLLRNCLKSMRGEQLTQLNSANRLIVDFAIKISEYSSQCLYLPTAVHLIQILQSLYKINSSPEIQEKTIEISGNLLTIEWKTLKGSDESGKLYLENLEILCKAFLEGVSIKKICGLIAKLQNEVPELEDKNDRLQSFCSFKKSSYPILFKSICSALQERIKIEIASMTNQQHLVLWKTVALSMQGLMTIVKVHEIRSLLITFLKKSLGILKIFLSQGIPILEIMLRSKPEEVTQIFKTFQTSTRFLHHLCCHSKLTKDTSLIVFVPQFRLTIETLIYRVKAALVANNCSDAFWMGNLKNKDLHGDDISSQTTISENSSQSTTDDILPEDDSDNEVIEECNENDDAESVEL